MASKLKESDTGQAFIAPGLIFADDDDVAPDVVWISAGRLPIALGSDGKLHTAPELIVEVLSPGAASEKRDREAKLKLYSRRGVDEYWIIDWRGRRIEIYRREDARLVLSATLLAQLPRSPRRFQGKQSSSLTQVFCFEPRRSRLA